MSSYFNAFWNSASHRLLYFKNFFTCNKNWKYSRCIKVLLISVLSSCNCLKFNLIGMLQFDDIDALLLIHFAILKKSDCCEFEVLAVMLAYVWWSHISLIVWYDYVIIRIRTLTYANVSNLRAVILIAVKQLCLYHSLYSVEVWDEYQLWQCTFRQVMRD